MNRKSSPFLIEQLIRKKRWQAWQQFQTFPAFQVENVNNCNKYKIFIVKLIGPGESLSSFLSFVVKEVIRFLNKVRILRLLDALKQE